MRQAHRPEDTHHYRDKQHVQDLYVSATHHSEYHHSHQALSGRHLRIAIDPGQVKLHALPIHSGACRNCCNQK